MTFPTLVPGQTIGICAPSSYIEPEHLQQGKILLEQSGFRVVLHAQAFARLGSTQLAGTAKDRAEALNTLIKDPKIDAILFAGGGNGALHLLPLIDLKSLKKAPKPLIGFSDATAILNFITYHTGIPTFHGPMLSWLVKTPTFLPALNELESLLAGAVTTDRHWTGTSMCDGSSAGTLSGGNLSVFSDLLLTENFDWPRDAILFLEDVSEELSHLDRKLCALSLRTKTHSLSGLIFGEFLNLKDSGRPFGLTVEDIVRTHFGHANIPIAMNAPFGHGETLTTLPIGAPAQLTVKGAHIHLRLGEALLSQRRKVSTRDLS